MSNEKVWEQEVPVRQPDAIRTGWAPIEGMLVIQFKFGEDIVSMGIGPGAAAQLAGQIVSSLQDAEALRATGPTQ
jgi:hypothetical protein